MFADRIEGKWINAFEEVFKLCQVESNETVVILSETQSRDINVHITELALQNLGVRPSHVKLVSPINKHNIPIRSTGASQSIDGDIAVLAALCASDFIVDLTVEGLLHSPETAEILKSGTRILMISNEHPEALERLLPDADLETKVKIAAKKLREAKQMHVYSEAGTDLNIGLVDAPAVGVWGYTAKKGTMSHWPGGMVVAFPRSKQVNGKLVINRGDINLTFKKYVESPITLDIKNDFVVDILGEGVDVDLMKNYFSVWNDKNAYAISHVGWGMNLKARYEALSMYDQRDTNGTELRALAGNFLFSTGANEFAGRSTAGHFDIPILNTTITLDGKKVVEKGQLK